MAGGRRSEPAEARDAQSRTRREDAGPGPCGPRDIRAPFEDAQRIRAGRGARLFLHGLSDEDSPASLLRHPQGRFDHHLRELWANSLLQGRTGYNLIGLYPFSLCLTTSNNTTPAATLTFSELIFPRIGIETIASHFSLTSRRTPLPSLPNTIASGTFMSKSVWRFPVPPSTPTTHNPRSF